MLNKSLSISLVLPSYNEESSLAQTVHKCLSVLPSFADHYEIIIVNDGSTDGSPAVADSLQKECSAVRVIHNHINLGVGNSLLIGMAAATCDLILHNSIDYPFDLQDLKHVLPLFPEADVVAVVRQDRSAHSVYRKLTSWVHHKMVCFLFWVRFRDMNFVQMYKRDVIQNVKVRARSPAFVTPELLIRARRQGYKVAEVEAVFHPRERGKASYGKARDILWALADMLSLRKELSFEQEDF